MPNQPFNFDVKTLSDPIEAMLAKLPGDSPLVDKVKQSTKTLISDLIEVVAGLRSEEDDLKNRLQQIQQIIYLAESSARLEGKELDPVLQQIKQVVARPIVVAAEEISIVSESTITIPVDENLPQLGVNKPDEPQKTLQTSSKGKRKKNLSDKQEDQYRQYCWELATISGNSAERKIQKDIEGWEQKPYHSPQSGDIVLQGTAFTSKEGLPPVWIGAMQNIPLFSELDWFKHFTNLSPEGQIWLSFTETTENGYLEKPAWCLEHENTLPLWYQWQNLLGWSIMAPEADVFVNNKYEPLSEQRKAICQTLLDYHKSFVTVLNKQDEYFLSRTFHKIYSCFHQFLSPSDLDANEVPQHVFYRLRETIEDSVGSWKKYLQIEERHPAGVLTSKEYLGNVSKDTEKNTSLSTQHPFLKNHPVTESEVLYWLRPYWRIKTVPSGQNADLLGSVLYCYDI